MTRTRPGSETLATRPCRFDSISETSFYFLVQIKRATNFILQLSQKNITFYKNPVYRNFLSHNVVK